MSVPGHPFDDAFIEALQGEDELGVVIRAHIHIEAKVLEFLELAAEASALEKMGLDYAQRVHLAVALGLKQEHAKGLHALGSLRNAFAHRLDSKLPDERVNNVYQALGPSDKAAVQEAYDRTETQMKQHGFRKFNELPARDRFVLIAVALQGMLIVAIGELKRRTKGPANG
jgi:hypothetical protein